MVPLRHTVRNKLAAITLFLLIVTTSFLILNLLALERRLPSTTGVLSTAAVSWHGLPTAAGNGISTAAWIPATADGLSPTGGIFPERIQLRLVDGLECSCYR
jgi:hypothetical protein